MTDFASNLYLTRKVYFNVEVNSKKEAFGSDVKSAR